MKDLDLKLEELVKQRLKGEKAFYDHYQHQVCPEEYENLALETEFKEIHIQNNKIEGILLSYYHTDVLGIWFNYFLFLTNNKEYPYLMLFEVRQDCDIPYYRNKLIHFRLYDFKEIIHDRVIIELILKQEGLIE